MRKLYILITLLLVNLIGLSQSASFVLDIGGYNLSLLEVNRTVLTDAGGGGTAEGSVHRYDNLITLNGITIWGKLKIVKVVNASIVTFDDDTGNGSLFRFQPHITTSAPGGYIEYELEFFEVITNQNVFITDYYLTGIDIDGGSEFYEIKDYSSYTVDATTQLAITYNPVTYKTKIAGRQTSLANITFDNTASFIARYPRPYTKINFTMGNTITMSDRQFSAQFGTAGGVFSNPYETWNPYPCIDISKTANTGFFKAGDRNTYTIKVSNLGGQVSDITLSDILPAGVTYDVSSKTNISVPASNVTQTLRDHFNLLPVSYSVNNGSTQWASDWTETNDDASPSRTGGAIGISASTLRFNRINTQYITRTADLSLAQSATLSFEWASWGLTGTEKLRLELYDGLTFNNITTFTGSPGSDTYSYTLPADYFKSNFQVRFRNDMVSQWGAAGDSVRIDNFLITYNYAKPAQTYSNYGVGTTLVDGTPANLVVAGDAITLHPGVFLTATYDVKVDCSATGDLTNTATVNPTNRSTSFTATTSPSEIKTAAAERCGTGTVTLTVTGAQTGQDYKWYDAATGGSWVQTGSTYSPTLSTSKIYYVSLYNTTTGCETGRIPVTATISPGTPSGTPVFSEPTARNSTASTNTGAKSPGSAADNGAAGTVTWTNPSNALISDNSRTSATVSAGNPSHYLDVTNFRKPDPYF